MILSPEVTVLFERISVDPQLVFFFSTLLFGMAFSRESRREIFKRDKNKCVVTGIDHNLEAAHIDHSRNNPDYDDPNNGITLHRREHYKDHIDRAGRNGLTLTQNNWAIESIWERLSPRDKEVLRKQGYGAPHEQLFHQLEMNLIQSDEEVHV